jgi:serine/threonine-protein kinase RsbW
MTVSFIQWLAGLLPDSRTRDDYRRRSNVTEDTAAAMATGHSTALGHREPADYVQVRMPAEGAYLSVLRTAAAGLAARLDFTLDEIEDLRIAIDEACAMLLSQAIPGTDLECVFELGIDQVTITVSVVAAKPRMPARDTFAWTVLSALAGTVDSRLGPDDRVSIVLAKRRGVSG